MNLTLPLRDAFFLPDEPDAIELRAFTHGLMPRTVPTLMHQFVEDWRARGVDAWNEVPNRWRPGSGERVGWWTLPTYLGDHFIAPLLGAPPGTCLHQPNVHWTVQCLLSSPECFADKKGVVLTEAEFPSVMHSVRQWQDLLGLDVQVVPPVRDGFVDLPAVLSAIGPETALVMLSHVGFTTGEKLTDEALLLVGEAIHAQGGLFALDGYHATGSIAVQVADLDVDVYFGGLLKEACGSSGNAYVYVRPGVELSPRTTGWFGLADPFGFHPEPQPHPEVPRRFMAGTTAVASMYHAVEGVRLLLDCGLKNVRAYSLALTQHAIDRSDAAGLPLRSPREDARRGAMIILDVPHADRLCAYLKAQHIYTDSRVGRYLRFAPFVWNTHEEIDHTFDMVISALHSGAYLETDTPEDSGPVT